MKAGVQQWAMRYLELTLPTAEENLALDEALLDEAEAACRAEAAARPAEILRLWEPANAAVVVGRSSRLEEEVDVQACRADGVPVLRRASGGAAVVAGPGCLMYAVVLDLERRPVLRMLDHAHRFVLETLAAGLRGHVPAVRCRGISDLVLGRLKFSGNSVRVKREHLLYHGTLLYDFPLEWIPRYLKEPPRQPDYRRRRPHAEFVANLPLDGPALRQAVLEAWEADEPVGGWPGERTAELVAAKYGRPEWHAGSMKGI